MAERYEGTANPGAVLVDKADQLFGVDDNPLSVRSGKAVPLGYRKVTSLDAAKGLGTIPAGARYALIAVSGAGIRWRDDGTDPTSANGMPAAADSSLIYDGPLASFRAIQTAASAVLDVAFYG